MLYIQFFYTMSPVRLVAMEGLQTPLLVLLAFLHLILVALYPQVWGYYVQWSPLVYLILKSLPEGVFSFDELDVHPQF